MLSRAEIKKLFDFTRKKRVRFIDVQIELVDHLASSIEELQKEQPTLKFDQALAKVYGRFPITGFNNLIVEKTKALRFFWWYNLKSYLIEFLKWPKILWFILCYMGFFVLSSIASGKVFFGVVVFSIVGFLLFNLVESRLRPTIKSSKFLSLTTYYGASGSICALVLQPFIELFIADVVLTGTSQIITCGLVSLFVISMYGLFVVIPNRIKMDVADKYNDYLHLVT